MADLVTSEQDVTKNVITLRRYRDGSKGEQEFHNGLIKKGKLFVVGDYENEYAFAPSRFAGYRSNTYRRHEGNVSKDGRETNPALNKIFGLPLDEKCDNTGLYDAIDNEFNKYCLNINTIPDNIPKRRRYWLTSAGNYLYERRINNNDQMDKNDAINDIGVDHPYTQAYVGVRYSRDPVIRAAVMARAGGVCEYCSNPGFICTNDEPYLECHHIIALAKDGADRKTNVIALCPNDHREAHFGKRRDDLEKDMIRKVKLINLSTAGQAGRGING